MDLDLGAINQVAAAVPLEEFGVAEAVGGGRRVNIVGAVRPANEQLQAVLIEIIAVGPAAAVGDEAAERNAWAEVNELEPVVTHRLEARVAIVKLLNEWHVDVMDIVDILRTEGFVKMGVEHIADVIVDGDDNSGDETDQAGGRNPTLTVAASSDDHRDGFVQYCKRQAPRQRDRAIDDAHSNFKCNLCCGTVHNAVVTICGHLFCWSCLWSYERLRLKNAQCPQCCHHLFMQEDVVPLYGGNVDDNDKNFDDTTKKDSARPNEVARPSAYSFDDYINRNHWFFVDEQSRLAAYSQPKRRFKCAPNGETGGPGMQRLCAELRKMEIFVLALIWLIWIAFGDNA